MRVAPKARNKYFVFNNRDEDKGQRNGIAFMKLLSARS